MADAVPFDRLFIAHPDLPDRLKIGAPLDRYWSTRSSGHIGATNDD
jgi:hypothetical protein